MPRRGSNNDTQTTDLGVFRLPWEFGKFAGKQNIVLPRAVGTKIIVEYHKWSPYTWEQSTLKDATKGTIVSSLASACSANDGIRLLVDAGSAGLLFLETPTQNDLPPRVQAALLLASKCLM